MLPSHRDDDVSSAMPDAISMSSANNMMSVRSSDKQQSSNQNTVKDVKQNMFYKWRIATVIMIKKYYNDEVILNK